MILLPILSLRKLVLLERIFIFFIFYFEKICADNKICDELVNKHKKMNLDLNSFMNVQIFLKRIKKEKYLINF